MPYQSHHPHLSPLHTLILQTCIIPSVGLCEDVAGEPWSVLGLFPSLT